MKRIIFIMLAFVSAAAFADVEIIVTASRIEEDSKTTPAYVRVIPEEEINKKTTIMDVLKTIPDISVRELSPAKQSISMGGFGDGGFGRTLILINGRPVNRPDMASFDWNQITLASVSRIEIIKGSMSSQYGDQAVAGVINIITKQAPGFAASFAASVANTLSNDQSAFVSYGTETTGVALGINRVDNKPERDRSDSAIVSANIDTFFNYFGIEGKLGGHFSNSEYELPGGLTLDEYDENPDQATDSGNQGESISYSINGTSSLSFGVLDMSVPLSYSIVDTSADLYGYTDSLLETVSTGVQISSEYFIGDSLILTPIGGVDFKRSTINVREYTDKKRNSELSETELTRIDSGLWVRSKLNCIDTYIFDAGIRYAYSTLDTDPDISHNPLVYDLGAVWLPSSLFRISLRYGKVFRYPFLDEQVSYYSGPVTVDTDLKPETGNSYTASIDFTKNDFSLSLSPNFTSMKDELYYNGSANVNADSSIYHYGASLEATYGMKIVKVVSGYAYDHAEFTDTNKILPRVPEHTVYGLLEVTPVRSVSISTDVRYSSEFYTDLDNDKDMVSGRTDWNANVKWTIRDGISWYLRVNNILDDRTPTSSFAGEYEFFGTVYEWSSWYPMPGRTFETGLKWVY